MKQQEEWLNHGAQLCERGRYAEAAAYFRRAIVFMEGMRDIEVAAAAGSNLGFLHCRGLGMPRDLHTALQWNRLVASWRPRCEVTRDNIAYLEESAPRPQPWPRTFEEPGLGRVIIKRARTCCRVGEFRDNALEVYLPPDRPYDYAVVEAWNYILNRLRFCTLPEVLDEHVKRDYPLFQWRIERGAGCSYGYRREGTCYTIVTPSDVRFDELITRVRILDQGLALMQMAAEEFLPRRLREISERIGIPFASCGIKRYETTTLGVCYYDRKQIFLACDLMKYEPQEVDALMIHELCHILHHGHTKKFYEAIRHYGGDEIAEIDLNRSVKLPRNEI